MSRDVARPGFMSLVIFVFEGFSSIGLFPFLKVSFGRRDASALVFYLMTDKVAEMFSLNIN